jgi:hypothetical protein
VVRVGCHILMKFCGAGVFDRGMSNPSWLIEVGKVQGAIVLY